MLCKHMCYQLPGERRLLVFKGTLLTFKVYLPSHDMYKMTKAKFEHLERKPNVPLSLKGS